MDISVLIVSWNVLDLLDECIKSILANTDSSRVEVLVIDSASTDGTAEYVRSAYPDVRLFAQSENIGFTRGTNLALREARGRYLMLLNPDTLVLGDALTAMQRFLDAHPEVGIVGPHTLNPDGSTQSSRRRFPTLLTGIFESTWLQGYAPRAVLEQFYVTDVPGDATIEVDWVQGSALMARREVYEQIGGLDEGYIMYSEELDWCRRAKDAGWRVTFLGDTKIIHYGGKSTDQVIARRHIHFQESKLRYFRKYHGALAANGLRLFLLTSYAMQIVVETTKGLLGLKRPLRRERVRQYLEVLRSGLRVT